MMSLHVRVRAAVAVVATVAMSVAMLPVLAGSAGVVQAATPCDQRGTVGGGALGVSPGPVGPPSSLGWDVGSGQCNGSFGVASDGAFTGGALELGLRAEQRRVGQVAQTGPNDYTVQTGPDVEVPTAVNRAWWNFQGSIAYGGSISDLDSLTLSITTDVGPNLPASPVTDLLALRPFIDDRNNQPNATSGFADLYQISQNPEFGWFAPTSDTDANPSGAFDYDAPGAWRFTLTAVEGASTAQVTVCVHTPGETCAPTERTVVIVAGNTTPPSGDRPMVAIFEPLFDEVVIIDDDTPNLSAAVAGENPSLVLVSSSVVPSKVNTQLRDIAAPLVTWEGYLGGEFGFSSGAPGNQGQTSSTSKSLTIESPVHPIAAGFSGAVDVTNVAKSQNFVRTTGGKSVATSAGVSVIHAWETGDPLAHGPAASRRGTDLSRLRFAGSPDADGHRPDHRVGQLGVELGAARQHSAKRQRRCRYHDHAPDQHGRPRWHGHR